MAKSKKDGPAKLRPDAAEIAYRVMLEATGQVGKTRPPSERSANEKSPEAMARGSRGGKRRKASLSNEKRSEIAKAAAKKRWSHNQGD